MKLDAALPPVALKDVPAIAKAAQEMLEAAANNVLILAAQHGFDKVGVKA